MSDIPGSYLPSGCGSYSVEKAGQTQVFPVVASKQEVDGCGLAKEEVGKKMLGEVAPKEMLFCSRHVPCTRCVSGSG